jgi:hypothetical protein
LHLDPDRDRYHYHELHVATSETLGRKDEAAAALEKQAAALRRTNPRFTAEAFAQFAETAVTVGRRRAAYLYVRAGSQLAPDLPARHVAQAQILLGLGR